MNVVNPKATKKVEIDGATFTVGVLPYGKRMELESMVGVMNKTAQTKEDIKTILEQNFEFVRWGIKDHSGLTFNEGEAVPFSNQKITYGDKTYEIVSDELMEIYGATVGLLLKLSQAVVDFNYLDGKTAKN